MMDGLVAALPAPGTPAFLALCLAAYLAVANLLAFALFGWDKRCAESGLWRVPERQLLLFALAGGWVGAKLAQVVFRHKARKQPFGRRLNLIGAAQIAGVAALMATGGVLPGWMAPAGAAVAAVWDGARAQIAAVLPGADPGAADTDAAAAEGEPAPRVLPRRFGPGSDG